MPRDESIADAEIIEEHGSAPPRIRAAASRMAEPSLADDLQQLAGIAGRMTGRARGILQLIAKHSGEQHRPILPRRR